MLFDKLCGICEKSLPFLKPILDNTKIFYWPYDPKEDLPKDKRSCMDIDHFFLPYKVVAIQDATIVLNVLYDLYDDQIGINQPRGFIDFQAGIDSKNDSENLSSICMGTFTIKEKEDKNGCSINGSIIAFYYVFRNKIIQIVQKDVPDDFKDFLKTQNIFVKVIPSSQFEVFAHEALKNTMCAVEEMMYFNKPNNFILEERNIKLEDKIKGKNKKIVRSGYRPIYTIMKVEEIRKKLDLSVIDEADKRNSPIPHERRGHWRVIHRSTENERSIKIRACWVGQSEKVIGNKIYKVVLDR